MKAMIFAAGLGTRLKPLTDVKPKALIEINGITLLELAVNKLMQAGVDHIIINLHHFAVAIREFVAARRSFGVEIVFSDETDLLLETGGGLKKAAWFFDDGNPFFVYNVDIVTNLDLGSVINFHKKNNALITLPVRNRATNRYLLFDEQNLLVGWKNISTDEVKFSRAVSQSYPLAFSGIHLIEPQIFDLLTEEGRFSIIDAYLRLSTTQRIVGMEHNESLWYDVGKLNQLTEANLVDFVKCC